MQPLIRPLPQAKINARNTALLVIDMENDFVAAAAVQETPEGRAIIPAINRLIAWARLLRIPIIFTHEMHRPDGSDYGIELEYDPIHCLENTPGCELIEGLDVRAQDYRIRNKRRYDCFLGTDLDLLLRCQKQENLICCGVTTHVCVMSTVYTARNLDYRVLVPQDAVAAVSPEHQAAALLCMSDVFAYITTVDQICTQIMPVTVPIAIEKIFDQGTPDRICTALMPALCDALACDRCFLYLRRPQTGQGRITHCYSHSPDDPNLTGGTWIEEGDDVAAKDPLMAIAFRTSDAVFVDDIETAAADVLNVVYEREGFGHRALIHAPIYYNGKLYGILEPCVFGQPRIWTEGDRQITAFVQEKLGDLIPDLLSDLL